MDTLVAGKRTRGRSLGLLLVLLAACAVGEVSIGDPLVLDGPGVLDTTGSRVRYDVGGAPIAARPDLEQQLVGLINHERQGRGLGTLASYWDLVDDARRHSRAMSTAGRIYHNPDLAAVTPVWAALGENVGVGLDVTALHRAFMGSAGHRANVLGAYSHVGVGVIPGAGAIWVTVVFMRAPAGITATAGAPPCPAGRQCDTLAMVTPSATFAVFDRVSSDAGAEQFLFGKPGDVGLWGDWDCDGTATPGVYRPSDGRVYLRDSNSSGTADRVFDAGGDVPLVGDWNGDGCDTISGYRRSEGRVYIKDSLRAGPADYSFYYGNPGDQPFAGDFDGDGIDTVGLYRVSSGFVYFRNSNTQGIADLAYYYGNPGDRITAGDWDGSGVDTLAVYRPSNGTLYIRLTNTQGIADFSMYLGPRFAGAHAGAR